MMGASQDAGGVDDYRTNRLLHAAADGAKLCAWFAGVALAALGAACVIAVFGAALLAVAVGALVALGGLVGLVIGAAWDRSGHRPGPRAGAPPPG